MVLFKVNALRMHNFFYILLQIIQAVTNPYKSNRTILIVSATLTIVEHSRNENACVCNKSQ